MPDEAGQATIRQAWTELWKLAPRFGASAQETAFLRGYCRQFANQRRLALLLGFVATVAYLPWDHVYARDPEFDQVLRAVLLNRTLTALLIAPFLALAMRARFAQDERFATAVVSACVFVDFLFYCRGFLLVPYPYDYMYFFMGMCINVVFGFAMLQMRARPVLLQLGSCVLAAAVTFAWNWQLKADVLADHEARIYQWAALSFLSTLAMIGYIVANQFERTRRASFAQTEQLAGSNASLTSRRDDVDRLNQALRMAVERAERESAARTRVLAAASHDLRQPLHALSIYSAILAADPVPQTLREVGAHIDQIARTLGALLHGLLDLSQLSSGHYVPARQRVALDEWLESICLEHDAAAAAKGLQLRRELAPLAWHGDTMAVSRIARNLLGNAIKYTATGSVTLRLEARGQRAVLSVEDTGVGIPHEAQPRIYEEFFQVGNQGRDRSQGVGLGLAIVHRLVELSDGAIAVWSAPGAGSRFTVSLPGVEAAPGPGARPAVAGPARAADAIAFTGRVYLVDDEPDILRSMAMLLRSWHCRTSTAVDANEATALFESGGVPDLLIVDLRLQGPENGPMLVERLQRTHGSFPVLVITGETASELLRGATQAGWTLLYKPIAAETLREALARVLPRLNAPATPPEDRATR